MVNARQAATVKPLTAKLIVILAGRLEARFREISKCNRPVEVWDGMGATIGIVCSFRVRIPARTREEREPMCFLQGNLLGSVPMPPEASPGVDVGVIGESVRAAIAKRYGESGGQRFGMTPDHFQEIVAAVVVRYAADAREAEQVTVVATLHVADLTLARACAEGNEAAWETFLARFREPLYETAYRIAKDEAAGRELADELYADLYGMSTRAGQRQSKLDYYMGRGSFEGWLRTVLSREYVNRYRSRSREVSLDQQLEAGVGFAAQPASNETGADDSVGAAVAQTLAEVTAEERFLLASWYLDQRTLADIGRQLHVHESTISRRLDRLTGTLRKRIRKRLQAAGLNLRECNELLEELDVRDLNVNVAASLKQEPTIESFHK
jgi:RNA polymerase sigma-70 factor (ECF subfamily)